MPEGNYDEEYVFNILAVQANLNLKYGPLFADQSRRSKTVTKRKKKDSKTHTERKINQSHPGSPKLTLQNSASLLLKQKTIKWTEKIFTIGEPLERLWI